MGTIEEWGTLRMHSCVIGKLHVYTGDMRAQTLKLAVMLNQLFNPHTQMSHPKMKVLWIQMFEHICAQIIGLSLRQGVARLKNKNKMTE